MKRSRFSEEQIIAILKEQEAGMATAEVCRRHGIENLLYCGFASNVCLVGKPWGLIRQTFASSSSRATARPRLLTR